MNKRLKELRKFLKLTQAEFGEKIGLKGAAIGLYESGDRKITEQTIMLLCKQFNVREEWLRYGINPMINETPISIDEYARQKNMTDLEKSIIMEYLDLDNLTRKKVMEMLKKVFKEYLNKKDKQIKQETQQKPTIIRVPARGGYYEIEETEESKAALRRDLEKEDEYDPDAF